MLRVSKAAKITLKLILEALIQERTDSDPGFSASREDIGLRLAFSPSQNVTFWLDSVRPGDRIIRYEGANILLIDEEMSRTLAHCRLDCLDTPSGPRLSVTG